MVGSIIRRLKSRKHQDVTISYTSRSEANTASASIEEDPAIPSAETDVAWKEEAISTAAASHPSEKVFPMSPGAESVRQKGKMTSAIWYSVTDDCSLCMDTKSIVSDFQDDSSIVDEDSPIIPITENSSPKNMMIIANYLNEEFLCESIQNKCQDDSSTVEEGTQIIPRPEEPKPTNVMTVANCLNEKSFCESIQKKKFQDDSITVEEGPSIIPSTEEPKPTNVNVMTMANYLNEEFLCDTIQQKHRAGMAAMNDVSAIWYGVADDCSLCTEVRSSVLSDFRSDNSILEDDDDEKTNETVDIIRVDDKSIENVAIEWDLEKPRKGRRPRILERLKLERERQKKPELLYTYSSERLQQRLERIYNREQKILNLDKKFGCWAKLKKRGSAKNSDNDTIYTSLSKKSGLEVLHLEV